MERYNNIMDTANIIIKWKDEKYHFDCCYTEFPYIFSLACDRLRFVANNFERDESEISLGMEDIAKKNITTVEYHNPFKPELTNINLNDLIIYASFVNRLINACNVHAVIKHIFFQPIARKIYENSLLNNSFFTTKKPLEKNIIDYLNSMFPENNIISIDDLTLKNNHISLYSYEGHLDKSLMRLVVGQYEDIVL